MARAQIHSGETPHEDLDTPGMSAAELARRLSVPRRPAPSYAPIRRRISAAMRGVSFTGS